MLSVVAANTDDDLIDGNASSVAELLASPGSDGPISLGEVIAPTNNTSWRDLPALGQYAISKSIGEDQADYHAKPTDAGWSVSNAANALDALFTPDVVMVSAPSGRWGLELQEAGYGEARVAVAAAEPQAAANRVEFDRGWLDEWYVNGPLGLQQGFTLRERPPTSSPSADVDPQLVPLTLEIGLSGELTASVSDDGDGLSLAGSDGVVLLSYRGLIAYDATGRELSAWLEIVPSEAGAEAGGGSDLLVRVSDRDAQYPLTIDPFVQAAKLTASDGATNDRFGYSVAVSGDTVVVGAHWADVGGNADQGSAYVFVRPASGWASATETAKLTALDGAADDLFGCSVAISGDTVVVGTRGDDVGANLDQGSAYVFVKPASGWASMTQTAKLTASGGAASDHFGLSVAISGDTVVVGTPDRNLGKGSAYVFVMPHAGWTDMRDTRRLYAPDGAVGDRIGTSVAIIADTVVVGAPGDDIGTNVDQGSAYVFVKPAGGWEDWKSPMYDKLTASDGAAGDEFGISVAISADTVVVGAWRDCASQGSAYVFVAPGGWWTDMTETGKLTASDGATDDYFGASVAISGDRAVVGAYGDDIGANVDQGSAYVFVKPGGGWGNMTQTTKLTASDGGAGACFGKSVAISGHTVAVGAYDAIGTYGDEEGSAYVLIEPGEASTSIAQTAKLIASDGAARDYFGCSVAVSGDTVVVGAYWADIGANVNRGSAYVFVRPTGGWASAIETAKLTASDGAVDDRFGYSVAIDDDTVVVGAYAHYIGANGGQGAAYVFVKPGGGWVNMTQTAKLTASDGASGDHLGHSVAISGDTIVVGTLLDDIGGNTDQGSAYLFVKPDGGWADMTQTAKLTASDGVARDGLGSSVGISGDTVVVGAPGDDRNQGSAYVFVKPGGGWTDMTETGKLTASGGGPANLFGVSVAINGDTLVVGAYYHDIGPNLNQGSAYVFVKPGAGWANMTETAELTPSDGAAGDQFGIAVAISGDTVVVGAYGDDIVDNADQGSAYLFVKPSGGWANMTESAKFTASDGVANDYLGSSVGISGGTVVVGAYRDDIGTKADQGSAYIFQLNRPPTDITLSSASVAENEPAGATVGTFMTTDADLPDDSHVYTLVDTDAYPDNAAFTIDGNQLKTAAVFDYETKNHYAVRVQSTDQGGLSTEEEFTISVLDVDEIPPTVTVAMLVTNNNQPTLTGTVSDEAPSSGIAGVSVVVGPWTLTATVAGEAWSVELSAVLPDGIYDIQATATDTAGNSASDTTSSELTVDTVAPTITGAPDRPANSFGWYNADVTVSFMGADELSGVATVSGPTILGDGADQSVTGTVTDQAGNSATLTVSGINIDKTLPRLNASLDREPASTGWYNVGTGAPTATFVGEDSGSGVASVSNPYVFGEGSHLSATGRVTDVAGNSTVESFFDVFVDLTAPRLSASLDREPGLTGWYNVGTGAPTATFVGQDGGSGVASVSDPYVFGEGSHLSATGRVTDVAGNSTVESFFDVFVDVTAPTCVHAGPFLVDEGAAVVLDGRRSNDALSGIQSTAWALDGDSGFDDGDPAVFRGLDGPSSYQVFLQVVDFAGNVAVAETSVEVRNVAPVVDAKADQTADEGATVSLAPASFTDVGTSETHTATIDWGDGTVVAGTVAEVLGSGTVSGSHVYADNGTYTVTVTVSDDDGGVGSDSLVVTVANVAPQITLFQTDSPYCGGASERQKVTATVEFVDPGTLDDHKVVIAWGDGTVDTILPARGVRSIQPTHSYAAGGVYQATAVLTDDDDPASPSTALATVFISGVGVVGNTLYVVGTPGDDLVTINQTGNGTIKVHANFLADSPRNVNSAGVARINVILCWGNDQATIAGNMVLPAIMDGGRGDDKLNGGGGGNVLLGGEGNDELLGGSRGDILIGGAGLDRLVGNPGEDVLVGGRSGFASDPALGRLANDVALLAFLADWNSSLPRPARERALAGLIASLADDGDKDVLTGSSGEDWFFAGTGDVISGLPATGKKK